MFVIVVWILESDIVKEEHNYKILFEFQVWDWLGWYQQWCQGKKQFYFTESIKEIISDLITIKIKMDHIDNVFISKSNPKKTKELNKNGLQFFFF